MRPAVLAPAGSHSWLSPLGSTGIWPPPVFGSSSSVFEWTLQVLNDYGEAAASPTPSYSPILSTIPSPAHPPWFHSPSIWQTRVSYPHCSRRRPCLAHILQSPAAADVLT